MKWKLLRARCVKGGPAKVNGRDVSNMDFEDGFRESGIPASTS